MADFVEIDGKQYEVKSRDANGVPVIQGHATTIHHTDEDGNLMYDEEGNPVRSVHVSLAPVQEAVAAGEVT